MLKDYDWLLDSLRFCGKSILYVIWYVFIVMMIFLWTIFIAFKIIEQFNFVINRNADSVNTNGRNVEDYELRVEKYIDEYAVEHKSYKIRKVL